MLTIAIIPVDGRPIEKVSTADLKAALEKHTRLTTALMESTLSLLADMQTYHEDPSHQTNKLSAAIVGKAQLAAEIRLNDLTADLARAYRAVSDYQQTMGLN